jgi:hypothetical protein
MLAPGHQVLRRRVASPASDSGQTRHGGSPRCVSLASSPADSSNESANRGKHSVSLESPWPHRVCVHVLISPGREMVSAPAWSSGGASAHFRKGTTSASNPNVGWSLGLGLYPMEAVSPFRDCHLTQALEAAGFFNHEVTPGKPLSSQNFVNGPRSSSSSFPTLCSGAIRWRP